MKKDKYLKVFFFIIASLAFIYIAIRAFTLQITHDEAWSFKLVDIMFLNAMGGLANTHWLNSIFIKIWSIILGTEPWMLRIHSVLSFLIYTYFLYRFFKLFKSFSSKLLLISFFFVNLFALEYFPLARGYALTLAFYLGSIFYAFKYINSYRFKVKYFNKSMISGAIAIAANYATFFQYSALIAIMILFNFYRNRDIKIFFKKQYLFGLGIYGFVTIITITNLILIDILGDDLRFGADNSYIFGSISSIFVNVFYSDKFYLYQTEFISKYNILSIFLFAILTISFIYGIIKKHSKLIFFGLLFFIPFILSHIVHYGFGKPFPIGRTALVLLPAIFFSVIYFFEEIKNHKAKLAIAILIISASFIPIVQKANFTHSIAWKFQSQSKDVLEYLNNIEGIEGKNVALGMYTYALYFHYYNHINPDLYKYRVTKTIELQRGTFKNEKLNDFDYLVFGLAKKPNKFLKLDNLKLLKEFKQSKIYVFEVVKE